MKLRIGRRKGSPHPWNIGVYLGESPCALGPVQGLTNAEGVLMLASSPQVFRNKSEAQDAIERTLLASRRLRESLVKNFLRARCPELNHLLDKPDFEIRTLTQ